MFRPGQIAHPMPIGRAKPLRCAQFFRHAHFDMLKWKKTLNLQVFSRIGKTMKKSQSVQLFFEEHLILEVKTTFRLQKYHFESIWQKHIKNESCRCYLGNNKQKAMFLVVSQSDAHFGFEHYFFCLPDRTRK